jgi:hypothetical protein
VGEQEVEVVDGIIVDCDERGMQLVEMDSIVFECRGLPASRDDWRAAAPSIFHKLPY